MQFSTVSLARVIANSVNERRELRATSTLSPARRSIRHPGDEPQRQYCEKVRRGRRSKVQQGLEGQRNKKQFTTVNSAGGGA